MTERCGDCKAYTPTAGKELMPGFGNCEHRKPYEYASKYQIGCWFTLSRFDPIEPRETLELTP